MIQAKRSTVGNVIDRPSKQADWFISFWMPFLQFLPSFGGLIRLGWSIEAIRGWILGDDNRNVTSPGQS